MPPEDQRELPQLPPIPDWHGLEPRKMSRNYADLRGPELVNNDLVYGQFGIMAVTPFHMTINHINLVRNVINHYMDTKRMFAVWRIDPPWKPISKKPQGKQMGSGKSPIHHYATPIRASQMIVEVGGRIELEDVSYFLNSLVKRLPCDSFLVSKEILEAWRQEELDIEAKNLNPITYRRAVENNLAGCHKWISPYDHRWFGKYQ